MTFDSIKRADIAMHPNNGWLGKFRPRHAATGNYRISGGGKRPVRETASAVETMQRLPLSSYFPETP